MKKRLIEAIKQPVRPIKRLVKGTAARLNPIIGRASLPARVAASTLVLRAELRMVLAGWREVAIPRADTPVLSMILVVEDGPEFFLACLNSLLADPIEAFEIIIVDNASSSLTRKLLRRLGGVTVIRVENRLPRSEAERQAVERSRGEFVAFLDPDCRVEPGSLAPALETARSRPEIGAVVGKTIRFDKSLEEAGGILWADGSSSAYGRGRKSEEPEFMFAREVDFSSGAFLLADRQALENLPERPARDPGDHLLDRIDFAARLRKAGLRTVYDPRVVLQRSGRPLEIASREGNRLASVVERLGAELHSQLPRSDHNLLLARNRSGGRHRVLYIDDRVPHVTLGAGFPRTRRIIAEMVDLGYFVTYYPTVNPLWSRQKPEKWVDIYHCLGQQVEVMNNHSRDNIQEFLKDREGHYDVILISRPHNMEAVKPFLPSSEVVGRPRIVYDAEALFSTRTIEQLRLSGNEPSPERQREMIEAEVRLVDGCSAVLSVSARDARSFSDHGAREVYTLSHCVDSSPTPNPFEGRTGLLFVGPLYSVDSPNGDSISWFVGEIFPKIRETLGDELRFEVAGKVDVPEFLQMEGNGVGFLGRVDDLTSVYNAARIFVAPTRYAAGIPLKCIEAAAQGIPIVTTRLLAEQLGWEDGVELLVADGAESFASQCARLHQDPELWGRLRSNALERIEKSYSSKSFSETLRKTVGELAVPAE